MEVRIAVLVLYGAGKNGKRVYDYFKGREQESLVYAFCDKNFMNIGTIDGKPVISYEDAKKLGVPFIITIGDCDSKNEIISILRNDKQIFYPDILNWMDSYFKDKVEKDRNVIAYYHVDAAYYKYADNEDKLNIFWGNESPFYSMFKKLNLQNVIELACGQGRHVVKYIDKAEHITLVDILKDNLDVCRERYGAMTNKISFYCNDGYDLKQLSDETYSALFTYDAMVHFEMMDIYSYLKDIYRVLIPGGEALFHHSNNGDDYRNSFVSNLHCRNFMSKNIFAYLAYKCGFEILEQKVIDWGTGERLVKELDCITLVRKPMCFKG